MHPIDPSARLGPHGVLRGARIVITGGAGFVGSHVTARLLQAGANVKVIDDMSTGQVNKLADALALGLTDNDIRVCDVRSADCAAAIAGWQPHVVVHLAAQASFPAAMREPLVDADINIRGTINVLQACADAHVGLIVYATSGAIYGQVPADQLPVTEQTPIAPSTPYGLSKATALHYLDWFRRHRSVNYVALALANVYGPRQYGLDCGVISRMANDIIRGTQPVICGDGQQTRDFVYVTDVAEAVALACTKGGVGLVNIGSGGETTVADVFNTICAMTNARVAPRFVAPNPAEARRMVMDISRAHDLLGWRPRVGLEEGINRILREAQAARVEVTAS